MTLQQIHYIITIADTGSLGKAAEKLYISQPSLTNALKELEKEFSITIFHRSAKGVTLTTEGERFLPYARQVYDQYLNLMEEYGKFDRRKTSFAVSTQHYSFAVKAFVELTRQVDVAEYELAIRETRTQEVIQDVASMRSEIGVLYLNETNRKPLEKILSSQGLVFHPLIRCGAYVYLWREHPLASKKSITLEELLPYPCLAFEQGDVPFYFAEELLSTQVYPRLIRCCDRATILNMMVGVLGYTLCSGIICEELSGVDYIAVPFATHGELGDDTMEIGYIERRNITHTPLGLQYIREMKRYLDLPLEGDAS